MTDVTGVPDVIEVDTTPSSPAARKHVPSPEKTILWLSATDIQNASKASITMVKI
jgi:hypothetical protein